MKTLTLGAAILAASLLVANADTTTESTSIPVTGNAADLTFELPQFNPSEGLLTGVMLTLDYTEGGTVNAFNVSATAPGTFQGEGSLGFNLSSTGASVQVTSDTGLLSGAYGAGGTETTLTSPGSIGSSSANVTLADLLSYEGTGNVDLTLTSDAQYYTYNASADSSPAGSLVGVNGNASLAGTASVTYTYTAVTTPEPSTLALIFAGMATFVALRRTRRLV